MINDCINNLKNVNSGYYSVKTLNCLFKNSLSSDAADSNAILLSIVEKDRLLDVLYRELSWFKNSSKETCNKKYPTGGYSYQSILYGINFYQAEIQERLDLIETIFSIPNIQIRKEDIDQLWDCIYTHSFMQ